MHRAKSSMPFSVCRTWASFGWSRDAQAFWAAWNCDPLTPSCCGPPFGSAPLLSGSGKFGTPCARMQWEKASALADAEPFGEDEATPGPLPPQATASKVRTAAVATAAGEVRAGRPAFPFLACPVVMDASVMAAPFEVVCGAGPLWSNKQPMTRAEQRLLGECHLDRRERSLRIGQPAGAVLASGASASIRTDGPPTRPQPVLPGIDDRRSCRAAAGLGQPAAVVAGERISQDTRKRCRE